MERRDLPTSMSTSSRRAVFLQDVVLSNHFEKHVFQRRLFDGVFRKIALRSEDVEELSEGHPTITAALVDRHLESRRDVVGEACAWYATHEHLGSDRVFPRRARKVDLVRGVPRSELLGGADGCFEGGGLSISDGTREAA